MEILKIYDPMTACITIIQYNDSLQLVYDGQLNIPTAAVHLLKRNSERR